MSAHVMLPGALLGACALGACGFSGSAVVDAAPDVPTDDAPPDAADQRVRDGLVALWTFDEPAGSKLAADTSGHASPVALRVLESAPAGVFPPTFGDGRMTADVHARVISMPERSRLSADLVAGGGVTLEVWAQAKQPVQGDAATPRFVVGLAKNLTTRNIALLQSGDRWLGLVRTNAMANGGPEFVSETVVSTTELTHVVIVADADQRQMFINGQLELEDEVPGPLTMWDLGVLLAVFEEPTGGRFWTGSLGLVAFYDRALSPAEVQTNYAVGHD